MSSKNPNRSCLINPLIARDVTEAHRAATPLELFYDLVYVVAIAFLAGELHHALSAWHHVGEAVLLYLFIFWCIWWPWNTYTWFASGYDTDDVQFRFASFFQMIGVIIIAVGVKPAFEHGNFMTMMIGYVVMRIPYILMWLKVARDHPESRPVALRYAIGVLVVQLCWTLAVLFYQNWYLFCFILLCELIVPWYAERSVDKGLNTKYHHEHIEERMGLLTIIVLGESILAAVNAFDKVFEKFTPELGFLVAAALILLFSMWWLYFDDKVEEKLHDEFNSFVWGYGHYFIFAAAAAVGALISVCVDAASGYGEISMDRAVLGLAIALAVYLVSIWICHDLMLEKSGLKKFELLLLAALVILIAVTTQSLILIGIAFAGLNTIRVWRRHNNFVKSQSIAR